LQARDVIRRVPRHCVRARIRVPPSVVFARICVSSRRAFAENFVSMRVHLRESARVANTAHFARNCADFARVALVFASSLCCVRATRSIVRAWQA
jgi:hypothetical protein